MTLLLLAILAGFLTVLAPCILPILPIILGVGAPGASKWRPVFVVLGFILAFSVFGAFFATVGSFFGVSNEALRWVAVVLLVLFGLALLFEKPYQRLIAGVSARLNALGGKISSGSVGKTSAVSGLLVGVSLGLIWTPCAGPILGTILTFAATDGNPWKIGILFAAYAIGAGVPMLGIAYSGGWVFKKLKIVGKHAELLNKIFGIMIIAAAILIATGYDLVLQSKLVQYYPSGLTALEESFAPTSDLPNLGTMPEFVGIERWINSEPLTTANLKGKVVLVDFWTYSCINCIRTFPYLRDWWAKYGGEDFVLIGVHTPEFEFEKDYDNVLNAAEQFDLTYPIALDNDYQTWRAYHNRYWPSTYIFDREGILRYTHHGEGEYDVTEGVIQELLGVEGEIAPGETPDFGAIKSPETYFGSARSERGTHFSIGDADQDGIEEYVTRGLMLNYWGFDGEWIVKPEYAQATEAGAKLHFRYSAGVVNFVMAPPESGVGRVEVFIDGALVNTLTVDHDDLYEAYASEPGEHQVTLKFLDAGVKVYTITFGA